jgi:hypothetical protein
MTKARPNFEVLILNPFWEFKQNESVLDKLICDNREIIKQGKKEDN